MIIVKNHHIYRRQNLWRRITLTARASKQTQPADVFASELSPVPTPARFSMMREYDMSEVADFVNC
jgi:hypothetical protein